jgi:peptide-methionine (S)-S-oxide reductase
VFSGRTGHAEVVLVVYDPEVADLEDLLAVFWENHDPTQHMRQGNDVGTQYRSVILPTTAQQQRVAEASRERYQQRLGEAGYAAVATEVLDPEPLEEGLPRSWGYAEDYHQQYLAKHPGGYCNHGFCQVAYD